MNRIKPIIASAIAITALGTLALASTAAAKEHPDKDHGHPSKVVTPEEQSEMSKVPIEDIAKQAKPLQTPSDRRVKADRPDKGTEQGRPDGPALQVEGELPTASDSATAATAGTASTAAAATTIQNVAWSGLFSANPNRQIGKLYFDIIPGPGTDWRECSGTVVNAANKSTVITAGHCVYNPDPDNNRVVDGNGFWYENLQFCPGYEVSCKLGAWKSRQISTTTNWFSGVNRAYDYSDDVAIVLLNRDPSNRLIQDVTGAQGISFNNSTSLYRHAFGYPLYDSRWPQYNYNGQDLIYAAGNDTYDSTIPGTMWMNSTMTGGASGGPWITSPNSSWFGFVNSVNSHKPYGGAWMSGPYFGQAEADLFNYWKTR